MRISRQFHEPQSHVSRDMFLPIPFDSVNRGFEPTPGRYAATCSLYADTSFRPKMFVFEYTPQHAPAPTICDLLVIEPDGAIRARDYVWMPDRSWRDSAGAKSVDLSALFPTGLFDLKLIRRHELAAITIGQAHV
jgi:hypothetical protein